MRRALPVAWVAFLLCALLGGSAAAQPSATVGELPAGKGTLSGKLALPSGEPAASVPVSLIAFQAAGDQGLRRTSSAADGSFHFDGISADPAIVYFVVAETSGVHHSQRASFAVGDTNLRVDFQLARQSANTLRARRGDSDVRFARSCSGLRVTETHAISNGTRSVIFVPENERGDARPIVDLELPEGAGELTNPFGTSPTGLVRDGERLRFWGPLYPGEQKLEFAYTLVAENETVSATWGYPKGTRRLSFLADPSLPDVNVSGLQEKDPREIFSRNHRRFSAGGLRDGERVALNVRLGAAPPLAKLREAQLWIELDDAALAVDERLAIEGAADATDASLLCIALPPEASDIRFSQATLALPISRDESGVLEVRGPLPAGEHQIGLRYQLPVPGASVDFERRFGMPVPLLGVLVSDTGVLPETTRLHRRSPVRRVDRNYLHLQAFQVAPDETVKIRFSRLEAPQALPRSATVGFAVLLAGGLLVVIGAPLRRDAEAIDTGETTAQRLAAERESAYAAIRDLDEDFDTGKLTTEDHASLRAELRERAVRLLDAERRAGDDASAPTDEPLVGSALPPAASPTSDVSRPSLAGPSVGSVESDGWRFCPHCGGQLPARPQFCPHCGERMADNGA